MDFALVLHFAVRLLDFRIPAIRQKKALRGAE